MTPPYTNPFDRWFADRSYVALKNHLYNYRLRKRAVERSLEGEDMFRTLEVGSGLSPVVTISDRIVYTDLSFAAVRLLRQGRPGGCHVVADAMRLPFREGVFSHVIASEVLEHLPDDRGALREMAAVLRRTGRLIVTFPHRRAYFAIDDALVGHFRRYELDELSEAMAAAGLLPLETVKVLGPLEKATAAAAAGFFSLLRKLGPGPAVPSQPGRFPGALASLFGLANRVYAGLARFDAAIAPRKWASVLLVKAEKR